MELLGYSASCAVLATFLMRTMTPLRLIAILSNILFLSYGYLQHIYPVFFLHVILLPVNTWRLFALQYGQRLQPLVLQPAYLTGSGARAFAPKFSAAWLVVGLLAGLIGPFTAVTAIAEPATVRHLAGRLILECKSTAHALAVRIAGKSQQLGVPDHGLEVPGRQLMRVSVRDAPTIRADARI